ncbi:MAG: zinc ribbon domain-containing protein [Chloroflexi bacterium]|nr:MAG: zinc ribbon domain-containing protein [Chloroflexota bacterium]
MQFGPNFFNKVSDSTFLPPANRMKKDMDDIAKGIKIAGTIGGMAMKAAKTIQDTIQTTQEPGTTQKQYAPPTSAGQTNQPAPAPPPVQSTSSSPSNAAPHPPVQSTTTPPQQKEQEAIFCDQCGARARPGKRFCNNCGAQLP